MRAAEEKTAAVSLLHSIVGPHEDGNPSRVDELAVGQVDEHCAVLGVECLLKRLLEFGRRGLIELARKANLVRSVVQFFGGDFELW